MTNYESRNPGSVFPGVLKTRIKNIVGENRSSGNLQNLAGARSAILDIYTQSEELRAGVNTWKHPAQAMQFWAVAREAQKGVKTLNANVSHIQEASWIRTQMETLPRLQTQLGNLTTDGLAELDAQAEHYGFAVDYNGSTATFSAPEIFVSRVKAAVDEAQRMEAIFF